MQMLPAIGRQCRRVVTRRTELIADELIATSRNNVVLD
jgi:hypothetical protein